VAPKRAMRTNLRFPQLPKLSVIGAFEPLPSDFIFRKTGDS
jgi:hypothetical protein